MQHNTETFLSLFVSSGEQVVDLLSPAQQKAVTDALLHFRLGGVELEGKDAARYQQLQKELSELQ